MERRKKRKDEKRRRYLYLQQGGVFREGEKEREGERETNRERQRELMETCRGAMDVRTHSIF